MSRWETLGDITLLPKTCFKDPLWESIREELWQLVAKSLGAQRLARQVSYVYLSALTTVWQQNSPNLKLKQVPCHIIDNIIPYYLYGVPDALNHPF